MSRELVTLQVQVYQFVTDSARGQDAEVGEQQRQEAGRGVVHQRGPGVFRGSSTPPARRVQILVRKILLTHRILPDKLEALGEHVQLLVESSGDQGH